MENMQFETDSNDFECVECGRKLKFEEEETGEPEAGPTEVGRKITCPTCSTEYDVTQKRDGMGLNVTVQSKSMTELEEVTERELEEDNA
mgnify:FL=1